MQPSAILQPRLGGSVQHRDFLHRQSPTLFRLFVHLSGQNYLALLFCVSRFTDLSIPPQLWLPILILWTGRLEEQTNPHDRLIHTHVTLRVLNPAILPQALRSVRAALFPNNMPAPARIPPTPEETIQIKRKCAESILGMVSLPIRKVYFGQGEKEEEGDRRRQVAEIEEILDVFSDSYLNAHLLYAVVDLFVVRLMPEMAEKGVQELRAERLDPFT